MSRSVRFLTAAIVAMALVIAGAAAAGASPVRASQTVTCDGAVIGPPGSGDLSNEVIVALYRIDAGQPLLVADTTPVGGMYTFTNVEAGQTYVIAVERAYSASYAPLQWNLPQYCGGVYSMAEAITQAFQPTSNFGCDFVITENPGITGLVTSAETELPLEGVRVIFDWRADSTGAIQSQTAVTGPDGRYSFYGREPGEFRLWFGGNGWGGEFQGGTVRPDDTPWLSFGALTVNAELDPAVDFQIDRAYSPMGTLLPAAWTNRAAGLPYGVEIYRQSSPAGVSPVTWDAWWTIPAFTNDTWPDALPAGTYTVRFTPPPGTYRPLWWIRAGAQATASPIVAQAGQTIAVNARFAGYVKAASTVAASATSVRKGRTVRITTLIRDASLIWDAPIVQGSAPFRLQRSYNGRTWTNIGGIRRTASNGRNVATLAVTRTTYFRAVPVNTSTFKGTASRAVRVVAR